MKRLLALTAALLLAACGRSACPAIACRPTIELSFIGASGAQALSAKGSVVVNGETVSFDCTTNSYGTTDAGISTSAACAGGRLQLYPTAAMPTSVTISASGAGGTFTGPVTLTPNAPPPTPPGCVPCASNSVGTVTLR